MWVDYKPVDDRYRYIWMEIDECHVLELRIGMNVNDHRRPEFFRVFSLLLKQP